jgi:hypothetical protein
MGKRKSNQLEGPFIAHALEMRLSPAWRAASSEVRLLLDRLEVEHAANGGAQNGQLVVTYDQFAEWGFGGRRSRRLCARPWRWALLR